MPRLTSRLVLALVVAFAAAATPAYAVWEAPQAIDQTSEGFDNSGAGDVAVGENGLATILFLQHTDSGTQLWATRRAADAAGWLTPPVLVNSTPSGGFEVEAAPDGSTASAWRVDEEDEGTPAPGDETTKHNVFGLGWPADQTGVSPPKTADLGDQGGEDALPVDADGKGFGWTAFIDGNKNLQIVRFSLTDPKTAPKSFTVAPVNRDPIGNRNLNETLSRSNPRLDVNADGDVVVSFVEERRVAECCDSPPSNQTAVWAVRKLSDKDAIAGPFQISQGDEPDPVTDHDPAIDADGNATILFGADPKRNASDPTSDPGPNRVFARRWLASQGEPRPSESTEFVSSSAADAPNVSEISAEAGPEGRVTAAWLQGSSQLNSAERSTTWTKPQVLSTTAASYDITVDVEGVATVVYRETANIRARRRAAGQEWADPDTINSTPVAATASPRVDAGAVNQADAYFVQNAEGRQAAVATRFTGKPPKEEEAPPLPDTEGCPADVTVLAGDAGANSIAGGDGGETIVGAEGDDTLSGNGGDDCIRGSAGNDKLDGNAGNDNVGGGDGDDTARGGDGNDTVTGSAGTDALHGDAGDDVATGGDGNDTVDGDDGNDGLRGELGDDRVNGGAGDDLMGGDEGNDTLYGGAGTNVLFGGIGDDKLFGGANKDTIVGEDGNDSINSGDGPDNVNGGLGDDKLRGGNGKNTLDGAEGNDGIRGGNQADRILGSAGTDRLSGFAANDSLFGGDDGDQLFGNAGNDKLSGDAGNDRARGGNGADRLNGGAGKDKLFGDSGKDRLSGGAAGDSLNGGGARDRISGGGGNDRIAARDHKRDTITCGAGKDRVVADRVDKVSKSCEKVRLPKPRRKRG